MSEDDDLFKRFQALRSVPVPFGRPLHTLNGRANAAQDEDEELDAIAQGAVSASRVPPITARNDHDEDLHKRVKALKGEEGDGDGDGDGDGVGDLDLGDEVEAYLASLSSANSPEDGEVGYKHDTSLAKDADAALADAAGFTPTELTDESGDGDNDDEVHAEENEETDEDVIAKALAGASLERVSDPCDQPAYRPPTPDRPDKRTSNAGLDEPSFSFPSLPTHVPTEEDSSPTDDDTHKRMNLLLGLTGPTARPGTQPVLPSVPKRQAGQGWNLPGYDDSRDNDLDSWCCICNKDAELVCMGCDEDVYCTECWKEGHESEKHRVKTFIRGKKRPVGA